MSASLRLCCVLFCYVPSLPRSNPLITGNYSAHNSQSKSVITDTLHDGYSTSLQALSIPLMSSTKALDSEKPMSVEQFPDSAALSEKKHRRDLWWGAETEWTFRFAG